MARRAESGEKDSKYPFTDVIVVWFLHVFISQTVRYSSLDKETASFWLGATENASSSPRLSHCLMLEADSRSKTWIDPLFDATTSRLGLMKSSDNNNLGI